MSKYKEVDEKDQEELLRKITNYLILDESCQTFFQSCRRKFDDLNSTATPEGRDFAMFLFGYYLKELELLELKTNINEQN